MRRSSLLIALVLAVPLLARAETIFSIPSHFSLTHVLDSQLVQYQGPKGELWTLITMEPRQRSPEDQKQIDALPGSIESQFRNSAGQYARLNVTHKLERRELSDGAILLALGYEALQNGGTELRTTLDFYIFWKDGSQVRGTLNWSGSLQGKFTENLDRLAITKLVGRPNLAVKRDAPTSGAPLTSPR